MLAIMKDQGQMIKSLKQQTEGIQRTQPSGHGNSQRISSPIQALLNTYNYI
jgi:hypothetical protein